MKNSARFLGRRQNTGRLNLQWPAPGGRIGLFFLLFFALFIPLQAENHLPDSNRILFINSYSMSNNWTRTLSIGFNNYFLESKDNVLVDVVELGVLINLGNRTAEPNFDWVADKISGGGYDLIAVADYPAFEFVRTRLAELPRGVPVVLSVRRWRVYR